MIRNRRFTRLWNPGTPRRRGRVISLRAAKVTLVLLAFLGLLSSCATLRSLQGLESVFMREEDPLLAESTFPLLIKGSEIILEGKPTDRDAIVSHASLLVMYASAFVQGDAELLPDSRYEEKLAAQARAAALFSRAERLLRPALAARKGKVGKADLPLLYWTAASMLGRYSVNPLDLSNAERLPEAMDLLLKAQALDPGWNEGAVEEMLVSLYTGLPEVLGGSPEKAEAAWQAAMGYSKGRSASLFISRARDFCLPANDYAGFRKNLEAALAVDVGTRPEKRLATELAKRQARNLLSRAGDLFFDIPEGVTP